MSPEIQSDLIFVLIFAVLFLLYRLREPWRRHQAEVRARRTATLKGVDIARMHPLDFERHCAKVIAAQGWASNATKASGDYGADIVAEKDGLRVVVQVKKWRAPVNLKAVQEIATARAYYRAHAAFVVSVSGYRESARTLAQSNRVLLLSHDDLFDFNRRVPASRS